MATLFKDLIKPMYSIGKETFTIKFDKEYSKKKIDFKESVVIYLRSIGIICEDNNEKCGNFPLLKLDGKTYLLERRYITTESKYLSEVAILIER